MRSFSSEMNLFLHPVMKEISKVYLLRVLVPRQGCCFSGFAIFLTLWKLCVSALWEELVLNCAAVSPLCAKDAIYLKS